MDHKLQYKNKALTKISNNGIVCDCNLVLIKKKKSEMFFNSRANIIIKATKYSLF